MTDIQGLDKAYARDNGIYTRINTMFVAGTKDFPQDHWDDLQIPVSLTAESLRYRNADKSLNDNPHIPSLGGHSLGGAVILAMHQNYDDRYLKPQHMEHQ
jgi:hypothetical protein